MNSSRASIRRLRTGVVPHWEIERLSVSFAEIGEELATRLGALIRSGQCAPLFVRGEWGAGKTHMLSYLRALAARRGLAHVGITLNPRSAALNYPQRFYPAIAQLVTFSGRRGIRDILTNALANPRTRRKIGSFSESGAAGSLGPALRVIVARFKLSGGLDIGDDSAWNILLGADLAWSSSKRVKALTRIREFTALVRALGAAGLVAIFDEAESIEQLFNRLSRAGAYETLGSLCSQDDVLCVFGITRRFETCIARDLENIGLFTYLSSAETFLTAWGAGAYSIVEPPGISERGAEKLAALIVGTYRDAYPEVELRSSEMNAVVLRWKKNPSRNPRRLVRALIDSLDSKRAFHCVEAADP